MEHFGITSLQTLIYIGKWKWEFLVLTLCSRQLLHTLKICHGGSYETSLIKKFRMTTFCKTTKAMHNRACYDIPTMQFSLEFPGILSQNHISCH